MNPFACLCARSYRYAYERRSCWNIGVHGGRAGSAGQWASGAGVGAWGGGFVGGSAALGAMAGAHRVDGVDHRACRSPPAHRRLRRDLPRAASWSRGHVGADPSVRWRQGGRPGRGLSPSQPEDLCALLRARAPEPGAVGRGGLRAPRAPPRGARRGASDREPGVLPDRGDLGGASAAGPGGGADRRELSLRRLGRWPRRSGANALL